MAGFAAISDDLTGANGLAGAMSRFCRVAVVNYDKLPLSEVEGFECLVVNTKSRMVPGDVAGARVREVLDYIKGRGYFFGKRIDSALRGNLGSELAPLAEEGVLVLTDTIPEYGRFTRGGFTIMGGESVSIVDRLGGVRSVVMDLGELGSVDPSRYRGFVVIVDTATHEDIDRLAMHVHRMGAIPVDPLPLLSKVAELKLGGGKPSGGRLPYGVRRVCFVVGSTHERTLRQIRVAGEHGVRVVGLRELVNTGYGEYGGDLIIWFDYARDRGLIDDRLVEFLKGFDAVVLSGGETANAVFEASNGLYIEGIGSVAPLVGVGVVRGGLLDDMVVVTKGGFIGGDDMYLRILGYLRSGSGQNA